MNEYLKGMTANELCEKIGKGEIEPAALSDILAYIPMPTADVPMLSPVETFQVDSGALRVTDPCYDMDTWCADTLDDVKNGRWMAFTMSKHSSSDLADIAFWRDERIRVLIEDLNRVEAHEPKANAPLMKKRIVEDFLRSDAGYLTPGAGPIHYLHIYHEDYPIVEVNDDWWITDIHVGVDSGQVGFADLDWYQNETAWKTHYKTIREAAMRGQIAVLERMAVSLSGYGDGEYEVLCKTDGNGVVVAARIVFIDDTVIDDYDDQEKADSTWTG